MPDYNEAQLHYRTLLRQLIELCGGNPFSTNSGGEDIAWALREWCFPEGDETDGPEPVEEELLS